jgi:hypothetical protein
MSWELDSKGRKTGRWGILLCNVYGTDIFKTEPLREFVVPEYATAGQVEMALKDIQVRLCALERMANGTGREALKGLEVVKFAKGMFEALRARHLLRSVRDSAV